MNTIPSLVRDYSRDIRDQRALIEVELNRGVSPGIPVGRIICSVGFNPSGNRPEVVERYRSALVALKDRCRYFPRSTPIKVTIDGGWNSIFLTASYE